MSDVIRIPLSRSGAFAIVDAADEKLLLVKWRPSKNKGGKLYAISSRFGMMHNYIVHPSPDMVVDHINGDGLDNRRSNLRVLSPSENITACGPRKDNVSGFKGVQRRDGRYRAVGNVGGVKKHLGSFDCPVVAARAYDAFVREHLPPTAYQNFPEAA